MNYKFFFLKQYMQTFIVNAYSMLQNYSDTLNTRVPNTHCMRRYVVHVALHDWRLDYLIFQNNIRYRNNQKGYWPSFFCLKNMNCINWTYVFFFQSIKTSFYPVYNMSSTGTSTASF